MADNVAITAGTGTTIAADDVGGGVLVQRVKATWGPDGTANDTDVATGKPMPVQLRSSTGTDLIGTAGTASAAVVTVQGIASGTAQPASLASGSVASGAVASGAVASGAFASGAIASGAVASGAFASGSIGSGAIVDVGAIADAAVTAGATGSLSAKLRSISRDIVANIVLAAGSALIGKVDVQFAGTVPDTGPGTGGSKTQRTIIDSSQIGTQQTTAQAMATGYTLVALPTNQSWANGMSPKGFSAAFTTLTRPANQTAYAAADSISDNATAGSVTALSATVSDTNDDPLTLTEILINSTDTGLAGKRIRAYLFNSDPTASTGVGAGDNSAYSQKKAGYIGAMSGVLETGFSDGTVGRLVPSFNDGAAASTPNASAGGFIVTKPTSGAKTIFVQYQAIDGFTPSANSTTIIGTIRGFQGRAS